MLAFLRFGLNFMKHFHCFVSLDSSVGLFCEIDLWDYYLGLLYGITIWDCFVGLFFRIARWDYSLGLLYGITLWDYPVELIF